MRGAQQKNRSEFYVPPAMDNSSYDAAGNLLYDGVHHYTYDAENRITQVDSGATATYVYDAEGRRALKNTSVGTVGYLHDLAGHQITEMSSSGEWNRGELYAGGRHLATYSNGTTYFNLTDWLGTERVRTDMYGNTCETITSQPFGDVQTTNGTCGDPSPMHFTGRQRDTESGLDDFEARYKSSILGRFMSPDPLLNSGRPWEPQSWNRYAYGLNNPLAIIDPTGLYNLVNNCAATDKKCNKRFQKNAEELQEGLQNLQAKLSGVQDQAQRARLQAALTAFGKEGDNNGVNVSFGATKTGGAAETDPIYDPKTNTYSGFNVTLDPKQISGTNDYGIDAAHEGTHISDYENYEASPATAMTLFQLEYRGYQTSIFAASALGAHSFSRDYEGKSYELWNGSWAAVDRNITNFVTRFHDNNGRQTAPETTPHNPQPN